MSFMDVWKPPVTRILLFLSLTIGFFACSKDSPPPKPNIVLIIADDLGWADVGYNGADFYETPHIDRLAAGGMIFDRFYPGAANCAPSRACLLTGMYTPRHHVYVPQGLARGGEVAYMRWKVPTLGQDSSFFTFRVSINQVAPEFESLAEMLKRAGYVSGRFGKWHIGDDNQGFDVSSAARVPGVITNIGGQEKRYYKDTTVAERLTEAGIDFITQNRDRPFFLYLSHWEVHGPMAAREDRIAYYREKKSRTERQNVDPVYAAEVEQVDRSVGHIVDHLRALGLEDNTLVLFTSDNGGVSARTSNRPLRAGKGTFYEGGIRTPMCVRWPSGVEPGTKTGFPVNGVDLMPTLAELVSVPPPSEQPVDGISILPLLRGEELPGERSMFFHFPLYLGGGGVDRVLPAYECPEKYWRAVPSSVMIKGKWKLIHYYEYDRQELFDLASDISESRDLSSDKPDVTRQLWNELKAWTRSVDAPIPVVPNEPLPD